MLKIQLYTVAAYVVPSSSCDRGQNVSYNHCKDVPRLMSFFIQISSADLLNIGLSILALCVIFTNSN